MNTAVLDKEELRRTIATALDTEVSAVTDHAVFTRDLQVDSLLALELVVILGKEYPVELKGSDLERLTCFGNVYDLLVERLS